MDRTAWLKEMRRDCEEQYNTRWAPFYGEKWGLYSNRTHQQFIQEFLELLPASGKVLDAACGAGRYLPYLIEKGHSILGIDQSQGMLAKARAKYPGIQFKEAGLQEMAYQEVFDGAICMDAMENVPPEDWPLVLNNFHRALKPHGCLYFTTETIENGDENEVKEAFKKAQEAGLPVVYGERLDEEVYHYHPTNRQVKEWVQQAGFKLVKEGTGDGYDHLICRSGEQMNSEFEQNLKKYAEVVVKVGLNLQPGQRLLIGIPALNCLTPVETAPLVRLIAAQAYRAGARLVDVLWGDDQLKSIRLQHAPRDSFEEYPAWQIGATVDYLRQGDACLGIFAHDPDLFEDHDQELLGQIEQINARNCAPILDYLTRNATNWVVIAAPVPGWAAKIFPGLAPAEQDARLWEALFDICRVSGPDPLAAWDQHVWQLARRSSFLNQKQYTALRFSGPGTNLTVGLPAGHIWHSGRMDNAAGIPFTANIPTEEIFTLPHSDKTEGVVSATKPLSFGGGLAEKFSVTFSEGRAVKITADKGEESLRQLIETDAGAGRLGEVALVPHSSPISQSGLTFYNILIDENASSHLALGGAYKFCLDKGEALSDEGFTAVGGNLSSIHVDFMIGSGEMDVDGLREDGSVEPVMRAGEWAFEI